MKILMISNMYPSKDQVYFGSFIKNIEQGLRDQGIEVDIIAISGRGRNVIDKIRKYTAFYIKLLRHNYEQYDVVHVSYPSHTFLPVLMRKRKISGLLVCRFHGLEIVSDTPKDFFLRLRRIISYFAIKYSDVSVVPSTYFLDKVCEVRRPNLTYKYPSGGVDKFRFFPETLTFKRQGVLRIGYVGRLDVGKGVDTLLKALKDLPKTTYSLTLVGDGDLALDLQIQARDFEINAEFCGAIENIKLRKYYNNMDVLIFPTEREGESFGNVGIEAMACGIPVIGSKLGGLTEYIIDGETGAFFKKGDHNDLAQKIKLFIDMEEVEWRRYSELAFQKAQEFERSLLTKGFVEFLKFNLPEKI